MEALRSDDADLRMRMRAHLRDLITRIEIFAIGHPTEYDASTAQPKSFLNRPEGDKIAEFLYSVVDHVTGEFCEFVQHVVDRRMSKEGRFLRVHFKTGRLVNLIPPGSLASGMELRREGDQKGEWQFVAPSISRMWQEFKAAQTPYVTTVGHIATGVKVAASGTTSI